MANPFDVQVVNPLQALLVGGQAYDSANKTRVENEKRSALATLLSGGGPLDAQKAAQVLLASGDTSGAGTFANLASNIEQRNYQHGRDVSNDAYRDKQAAVDAAFRRESLGLQRRAAERADDPTPSGFRKDAATGGLTPIPGGPQDPAYISTATKPRSLSVSDIGKLSDEGQKFGTLTSVANNFKDNYGGYTPGTGDLSMAAGRYLPERIAGKDRAEAAAYWQEYDRYKNVVRNELFGSALTVGETKAFAQADVDPSMQPAQIRKNLARQKEIVEAGLKRKASAMIAAGYDPETIGRAYGVDLGGLGVNTQRRGSQPQAGQPIRVTSPQQAKSLPSGTPIILPDGSPGVVP